MGPDTIYLQKFSISSLASGRSFLEVLKRPNLPEEDAKAIAKGAPSVVDGGGFSSAADPDRRRSA